MPADPTPARASRREYLRRRVATPPGRDETLRWRRTATVLALHAAAVAAAALSGLIATSPDDFRAAWHTTTDTRSLTPEALTAIAAAAAACTLPLAVSAARLTVRLRPWRPHSGSPVLRLAQPERLKANWPAWRAAAQAQMLAKTVTQTPRHRIPDTPEPAAAVPTSPSAQQPPQQLQAPHEAQEPEDTPHEAQQPEDTPHEAQQPEDTPHEAQEPEDTPHEAQEPEDTPHEAQEPEDTPHEAQEPEEARVLWLYSANEEMSLSRQSVLVFMVSNNRACHQVEAERILGVSSGALRGRLRRAADDGWTRYEGHNYWTLDASVTTDLEILLAAIEDSDEAFAAKVAARMGPPVPTLRDDWIDDRGGGPTPRERLREGADDALAAAAERWPHNRAFPNAADRLYGDG